MTIKHGLYRCVLIFSLFSYVQIQGHCPNHFGPHLAHDHQGNVVITWSALHDRSFVIKQSMLPFNGTWSEPVTLSSDDKNSLFPMAALNNNGEIFSAWQANQGMHSVIEYTITSFGDPASSVTRYTPLLTLPGKPIRPYIVLNESNRCAMVWENNSGTSYTPFAGFCSLEDPRLAMSPLSLTGSKSTTNPYMTIDPLTHFVFFVWEDHQGAYRTVNMYSVSPDGYNKNIQVLSSPNANGYSPRIVTHELQPPAVVWHETDKLGIYRLEDSSMIYLSWPGYRFANPHLAMNSLGQMIITANASSSESAVIVAAIYDPLIGWGDLEIISDTKDKHPMNPKGAINNHGECLVVWQTAECHNSLIKTRSYSKESGWSISETLSNPHVNSFYPSVYLNDSGYTVYAWMTINCHNRIEVHSNQDGARLLNFQQ